MRYGSCSRSSTCGIVRWAAMLPLILVGSMLFWSVALTMGGVSLMAATGVLTLEDDSASSPGPTVTEPMPGHIEPITVRIQESAEPEDVNDNAGAAAPADDSAGDSAGDSVGTEAPGRPTATPTGIHPVLLQY